GVGIGFLLRPGDRRIGRIVSAPLTGHPRLEVLVALCEHLLTDAGLLERLKPVAKRVTRAIELRNDVVHAFWLTPTLGGGTIDRVLTKARGHTRGAVETQSLTLPQLHAIHAEIRDVAG